MCTLGNYWKIWQFKFFFLWIRIGKFCLFLKNLFFSGCFHKKETISELKNIVIFATLCRSSAFGNLHIIQPQNLASSFHMEVVLVFGMTQWSMLWYVCDEILKIKGLKNSWDSLKITYYYYINTYKTMRPIIYNVNVNFTSFKTLNEDLL